MITKQKESRMLQKGDVIELKSGMKVYASIPEHFVYSNKKGSFSLTHHDVVLGGEFEYLCGKYIIYKTTFDGGLSGGLYENYAHEILVRYLAAKQTGTLCAAALVQCNQGEKMSHTKPDGYWKRRACGNVCQGEQLV